MPHHWIDVCEFVSTRTNSTKGKASKRESINLIINSWAKIRHLDSYICDKGIKQV